MAYNDEALRSKLSTLNETQESIVSVSQWITFHRRYADKIAQVWFTRLKDVPPAKRLNFVYLVNDIVQNSKARKRPEFPNAFSPIIAEAVQQAYRSATQDIQNKIRRVLDVWKARAVFEESILSAITARIDEVDKAKGGSKGKKLLGNSLFSSGGGPTIPKELESLAPLQTALSRAEFTSKPLLETGRSEYAKVFDSAVLQPSPPVHAASLSSLIKKLSSAEASLNDTIAARKALVADLKRLLDSAESDLASDENAVLDLAAKRTTAETTKRDVEDSIMRELSETPQLDEDEQRDYTRPDVEELTPEPDAQPSSDAAMALRNPNLQGLLAGFGSPDHQVSQPQPQSPTSVNGNGPSSSKKRKLSHDPYAHNEGMVPDLGAMDVDASLGSHDARAPTPLTSYVQSQNVSMPGSMHFDHSPTLPPTNPVSAPVPVPDMTSTLEEDVDALIRGANAG